jgi:hypothetical protein
MENLTMNRPSQWLFEAPVTLEETLYSNPEYYNPMLEAPPPTPRTCNSQRIPVKERVQALTAKRVHCPQGSTFNVANPFGVIKQAVERAIEMLDNTIDELVNARNAVCKGATPAWPLLGDITLCLLKNGLSVNIDDIRSWTAGTFVNRSVAEVIRRLVRVRNLIARNELRYVCGGRCDSKDPASGCIEGDWAFVCISDPCPSGFTSAIVHLCRSFWLPAVHKGQKVDPKVHAEFQAQTIIHEASHLTHCTEDTDTKRSSFRTIGGAECLSQFVAATNGSPIDPDFAGACAGMKRCFPSSKATVTQHEISGFRFARPGSVRLVRTRFRPQNAIRLKGRPAVRR